MADRAAATAAPVSAGPWVVRRDGDASSLRWVRGTAWGWRLGHGGPL